MRQLANHSASGGMADRAANWAVERLFGVMGASWVSIAVSGVSGNRQTSVLEAECAR